MKIIVVLGTSQRGESSRVQHLLVTSALGYFLSVKTYPTRLKLTAFSQTL